MSGSLRAEEDGQLAVMDAVVFFAIAALVSSMTFSFAASTTGSDHAVLQDSLAESASEILGVFMRCSVGIALSVGLDPPVTVPGSEQVSDLLSCELEALLLGWPEAAFGHVNGALLDLLESMCPGGISPSLAAFGPGGSSDAPLLVISHDQEPPTVAYAASTYLPVADGELFTIILTLEPSLLPEDVDV